MDSEKINPMNISVLVTTKNEEHNIERCLKSLSDYDDIIVIDSKSDDKTCSIAKSLGARIENFIWNGQYPKKRQWCLDHLKHIYDWVLFIDADEIMTPQLSHEIKSLDLSAAGYFIKAHYLWEGKALKHGIQNNKLVLINRQKIHFPEISDLKTEICMGEMEGHYQPVLKPNFQEEKILQLRNALLHNAYNDSHKWTARHERYAKWEAYMIQNNAYPKDPVQIRESIKKIFRTIPFRAQIAFIYSYIIKFGFTDGKAGYQIAESRFHYYKMVSAFLSANK